MVAKCFVMLWRGDEIKITDFFSIYGKKFSTSWEVGIILVVPYLCREELTESWKMLVISYDKLQHDFFKIQVKSIPVACIYFQSFMSFNPHSFQ